MPVTKDTEPFLRCARVYADLVHTLRPQDWGRPGLGQWDVRALVGHTTRALTTVVDYLAAPQPPADDVITAPEYLARFVGSADKDAADRDVAERGRVAGADLGADPARRVTELLDAVAQALAGAPAGRLVATRFGTLALGEYLRTRTFEVVVHGLDIARAVGAPLDAVPAEGVAAALELAAETAVRSERGATVLLALTGRAPLPAGFSLL